MKDHAQVVIIGAGIMGCSVAYYLTQMGRRDVVVLEQGPLVQNWGSSSHAPGLMFQHNNSKMMCTLAQWSVQLYLQLQQQAATHPLPGSQAARMVYQTGSLEIAHTPERWQELKRKKGNALAWGLDAQLVTAEEVKGMVPPMRTDDLYGAFYVSSDMDVTASLLCETMMSVATEQGAAFYAHTPVTGIEVEGGRVRAVTTPHGQIACELVVCAAGLWGPLVGRMAGVELPMVPCQHLYARTGPLPELAGESEEVRHPVVRYQDKDMYFRQHRNAYGVGTYRHDPLLVFPEDLPKNDHPAIFPFTPEHFAVSWADATHRFPSFAQAGLSEPFNGLFSFTPDGNSLLGESAKVGGFWAGEAVWVTHAGGAGRALAEWIVGGTASIDLHEADVNRFHAFMLSRDYIRARAERQYIEVYDIIHPMQQTEQPRDIRVSPFHARQKELGAAFFEAAGWERPQWFTANEGKQETPDAGPEPVWQRHGWTARHWSPISAIEHCALRERAGLFDASAFTKIAVSGSGALGYLQRLASNNIDQPSGRTIYTSMLNEQGGIECDLTITRLGPQTFWVITGSGAGMHDLARLRMHRPADGSVELEDVTSGYGCLGLWGPRARDVLSRVTRSDVSNGAFPYMTAQRLTIGYVPALAIRISYAGELGWEIYAPSEYGLKLWDTLWNAGQEFGITPIGGGAFDSLRLEKGYRLWGVDIHGEYNPYEAGIGFAVRLNKGDFIGRAALERVKTQGITRKLCALTFDDPSCIVLGKEPILDGERVLGCVTSANFGYSIGKSIAYGYLPLSHARTGTPIQVYYFGERLRATVAPDPLYDPQMTRLKG